MSPIDRELLLKDLCARLPYGVKVTFRHNGFRWDWEQTLHDITLCDDGEYAINGWGIHGIKPYLRPMSSMTEEEQQVYYSLCYQDQDDVWGKCAFAGIVDFCLKKHLDFRGLIEKGLALKAPEGMYEV